MGRVFSGPSSTQARRVAETRGRAAETAVAALWGRHGYEVLARRLRTEAGEIDLVVADEIHLVFIEVKARHRADEAAYAVQPRQQKRLLMAAEAAMAAHKAWQRPEIRFDVALVYARGIRHVRDAIRYN